MMSGARNAKGFSLGVRYLCVTIRIRTHPGCRVMFWNRAVLRLTFVPHEEPKSSTTLRTYGLVGFRSRRENGVSVRLVIPVPWSLARGCPSPRRGCRYPQNAQERLPIPTEPPATVGGGGDTVRTEEEAKEDNDKVPTVEEPAGVRRSGRSRKAPVRLNL